MRKILPLCLALVGLSALLPGCIVINIEKADGKKKPAETPTVEVKTGPTSP